MSGGTGSILVLRPTGGTVITFDLDANNMATGSYVVNLDTLRLGEAQREVMEYAQRVGAEGGDLLGIQNPLVPVSFEVVVVSDSREGMIEMVHDLRVVLMLGGYLEYKPEDLPGGTTASYYAYLPSAPGGLKPKAGNRWDEAEQNEGGTGVYVTEHLVELMTMPLLLSSPTHPVTAVAATTIQDRDDATGNNFVTLPAATLAGDGRALMQITMRNLETGSYDEIVGVYIFPRIYGLTNYKIVFEPGTIVIGATEWATINDPGQASGGSYQRLTPTSDGLAYRLRFAVANWTSFVGRHLLMIACRDNGSTAGDYEVRGGWSLGTGEVLDPTPWRSTRIEWLGEWQLFALGEMEFLGTQTVVVEDLNTTPYYELEVRRVAGGSGTFEVDFFIAGPVDLRPLYVDCYDRPFDNDEKLLISNLAYPTQVAHIVDQASLALVGPVNPLGLLPLANPGKEATDGYRLYFLWERLSGTFVVNDDFSGYDANWQKADDCDGGWTGTDTLNRTEGQHAQDGSALLVHKNIALADFSGWGNDDYFISTERSVVASTTQVRIGQDVANYYWFSPPKSDVWDIGIQNKGGFASVGAPAWGTVDYLAHFADDTSLFDNWRFSARDPAGAYPNDFGTDWNYQPAGYPWLVYTDAALRCAGNPIPVGAAGVGGATEQSLVSSMVNVDNITMKARCYVFASSTVTSGKIGLIFRVSDQTSGSEDCYALIIDSSANTLTLYEYTAGAATALESVGFTVDTDVWYWLGVTCREGTITCYASGSEAALWDIPLIRVVDYVHTIGKCGFIVVDGMGRFDDAEVWVEDDRYDPQDTASVEVKILPRSIHPHYE